MVTATNTAPRTAGRRRLVFWLVGGAVIAAVLTGFAWRATRASLALDEAETALRRNDPIAARMQIEPVLARQPKNERALLLATRAARRSGAHADAERFLTELEGVTGSTEASQLEWLLLGVQQGDFGENESRLRAAVGRNHPEEISILEALARGYATAYRWSNAQEALARLLEHEPDHVPGLILRATISERFRRLDAAEEDLRRAVTKGPENAAAQAALARLLLHWGRTREAILHFERALQLQPNSIGIRLGLARALVDAADMAGAEAQLEALLAADPNHADALVERGRLELRRQRFEVALPFLERATRAAPWHREGHSLQLIALKELGRTDAVAVCASHIAELEREDAIGGRLKLRARDAPTDLDLRMQLWEWSLRNGQTEDGIAWLAEVLRAEPGHAAAHAALAGYFDRSGQPRRAAEHRAAAGK